MALRTACMQWCAGVVVVVSLITPALAFAQDVVGTMGAQQLRAQDLKRIIDAQPPEVRKQLATDLGALDRLVRSELVRQAILTETRQKQWDKKADVQLLMERAREQVLITSYVNDLARPPANYPSEDEVRGFYEASKASFTVPAEYELMQIFVQAPDESDKVAVAAALKKASDLAATRAARAQRLRQDCARELGAQGERGQGRRAGLGAGDAADPRDPRCRAAHDQGRAEPAHPQHKRLAHRAAAWIASRAPPSL